jgi:hypothetical protein
VASERGIVRPDSSDPHVIVAWLARHLDWCAANRPAAEKLLPVLRHLVGRVWALIDPSGSRRITIGPCIASAGDEPCEGVVYATVRAEDDPRPSVIFCETCGLEKSPIEWLRFGRIYARATADTGGGQMISRRAGDGTVLMDREDLSAWLGRPVATIRARCTPVTYDRATNRALYDDEACREQLADLTRRFRVAG